VNYDDIDLATFEVTKYNDHLRKIYREFSEAKDEIPVMYVDGEFIGFFDNIQLLEDNRKLDNIIFITEYKTINDDHTHCISCGFTTEEIGIPDNDNDSCSTYTASSYAESTGSYDEYIEENDRDLNNFSSIAPMENQDYGTFGNQSLNFRTL
jgi:hypothetical protein